MNPAVDAILGEIAQDAFNDGPASLLPVRRLTLTNSGEKAGQLALLGGAGLVCTLTGPGRIYLQTRSPSDFLGWLIPQLPSPSS